VNNATSAPATCEGVVEVFDKDGNPKGVFKLTLEVKDDNGNHSLDSGSYVAGGPDRRPGEHGDGDQ